MPEFGDIRLVSMSRLDRNGVELSTKKGRTVASQHDQPIFEAVKQDSLYIIETAFTRTLVFQTASSENQDHIALRECERDLMHCRLGHANLKNVEKLVIHLGVQLSRKNQPVGDTMCEACLAGKMKESFRKSTDSRTSRPIRRLHADLSGIKSHSIRGYRYYLLIVDDVTRYCWLQLLKSKETVKVLLKIKETIVQV